MPARWLSRCNPLAWSHKDFERFWQGVGLVGALCMILLEMGRHL